MVDPASGRAGRWISLVIGLADLGLMGEVTASIGDRVHASWRKRVIGTCDEIFLFISSKISRNNSCVDG